jgi:hypothetical protein
MNRVAKWHAENKDRCDAHKKKYHDLNKDKIKQRADLKARTAKSRFTLSVRVAKSKNKEFALSLEEYAELISQPCFYCDGYFGKVECAIGLDRLDSSIGYVLSNVVSCCYTCNKVKSDHFTPEETKAAVRAVIEFRKGTK